MRDRENVTIDHLEETGVGLSESVVILIAMATGLGETLHRSTPKCRKRLVTGKWCEIRQRFVLHANRQTEGGLSKSAVILVAVSTTVSETLHR